MNSTDPLKATLVSLIFNRDCTTGTTDGETTLIEYDVDADEVVRDIDGHC